MSYVGTSAGINYAQIAIETSAKTLAGSPAWWPLGAVEKANRDWNRARITVEGGRSLENTAEYQGGYEPTYTADFGLTNAKCLYLALDGYTAGGLNIDHYDHTIMGTGTSLPYHRVEIQDIIDGNSDFVQGCWVESLTLSATQNDKVNCSQKGIGLLPSSATQTTTIAPDASVTEGGVSFNYNGEVFRFQHGAVHLYNGSDLNLNAILHSFTLNINNTIKRGPIFGGTSGSYHTISKREITIELTLDLDSTTAPIARALVDSGTQVEIYLDLVRTNGTDDILLHFPSCKTMTHVKDYSDSIQSPIEFLVTNPVPSDVPTAGTFNTGNTGWIIDINDAVPDYAESSTV